jgi:hypothetical protein
MGLPVLQTPDYDRCMLSWYMEAAANQEFLALSCSSGIELLIFRASGVMATPKQLHHLTWTWTMLLCQLWLWLHKSLMKLVQ